MTPEEYYKVKDLCYSGKKGERISSKDMKFLEGMFKKYPDDYRKAQKEGSQEAMDEVNPF